MEKQTSTLDILHESPENAIQASALQGLEDRAKRTECAKFFSLGDNMYKMVLSEEAMHYRDSMGAWQDIDNTLKRQTGACGGTCLANRDNGRLKVRMDTMDAPYPVQIENDRGHVLRWRIVPQSDNAANKATRLHTMPQNLSAIVPERTDAEQGVDACSCDTPFKAASTAIYADIMPGIDMRCRIEGTTFKEEMILHSPEAIVPIAFEVDTGTLTLALQSDHSIHAMDRVGDVAFVLPAPFLIDAKGAIGDVCVALKQQDKGLYTLLYTPDSQFLSGAAYPVTLDPTVRTTDHSTAAISKNAVKKDAADNVFRDMASIVVEDNPTAGKKTLALYRFEQALLPSIDASYYITDATLSFSSSYRGYPLYLHEILEDWSPDTVTYANKPAIHAMCADALFASGASTLSITNMVRRWYEGKNFGFAMQVDTKGKVASIATTVSNPTLSITYMSRAGLEDTLAYESHGFGRAGTAHVGLFNGNLVVEHADTTTRGNRMPVSVRHYYNSCYHDKDMAHSGKGWKHSMHVTLHRQLLPPDTTPHYVLTDADGTRHFFKLRSGYTYDDLSGLYMTLVISGTTAIIEDKGNNRMEFDLPTENSDGTDGAYKLIKRLTNAQGDSITVTSSEEGRIDAASDGIGRETRFAYAEDGLLEAIYTPESDEPSVQFTYDAGGHLVRIVYADDIESTYAYDERGLLCLAETTRKKVHVAYSDTALPKCMRCMAQSRGTAGCMPIWMD